MRPFINWLAFSFSILYAGYVLAVDVPEKPVPVIQNPLPESEAPVIRVNPPDAVTKPGQDLRGTMRIERGGAPVKLYKANSAELSQLRQRMQLLERQLVDLDRFTGGQSSRIQRCMAMSYTPQQQAEAGCGPRTTIAQCSYMLLVNCMGGSESWNRSYADYTTKWLAADRAMQDVISQYQVIRREMDATLSALGPAPAGSEGSNLPQIQFPSWPTP